MPAQTYTKEFIANKLQTNNEWLWKGVLAIYKKQTDAEQAAGTTREDNGVGFNGADAEILSSFAQRIINWQNANPIHRINWPCPLSIRQLEVARRRMVKYAGQLAKIANNAI